jgi:hypothetical protein
LINEARIVRRIEKIKEVLPILEDWLSDILREGLARTLSRPYSFWDNMSKILNDFQAKGLSNRIANFNLSGKEKEDFAELYEQLSMLYLLVQALKKIETFEADFQADLLTLAGVSSRKEDILNLGETVQDHWQVVAIHQYKEEQKLQVRKVWLLGALTQKHALILDFVYGEEARFETDFAIGLSLDAELCFYPSVQPFRALIKNQESAYPSQEEFKFLPSLESFLDNFSLALGKNPWLSDFPCGLAKVQIRKQDKIFQLVDKQGFIIPISSKFEKQWELYLFSEGQDFAVFGEWNGKELLPLTVYSRSRFLNLAD